MILLVLDIESTDLLHRLACQIILDQVFGLRAISCDSRVGINTKSQIFVYFLIVVTWSAVRLFLVDRSLEVNTLFADVDELLFVV